MRTLAAPSLSPPRSRLTSHPPPPPPPNAHSKWLGPGGSDAHGYSVFAEVVGGKDVVQAIAAQAKVKAQAGLNYLEPAIAILSVDA